MQVSQPSVYNMDGMIDLSKVTSRNPGGQVYRYPEGVEEAIARIVDQMENWTPEQRAAEEAAQLAADGKFLSETDRKPKSADEHKDAIPEYRRSQNALKEKSAIKA